MLILFLLLLFVGQTVSAQTVSELIEAGRIAEARQRVEGVDSLARYRDYLVAAAEMDAARACSLYQVVSWRYPETDVDRLAQQRLLAYQAWGQSLPPFVAPGWSYEIPAKEESTQISLQPEEAPPAESEPKEVVQTQQSEPVPAPVTEAVSPESLTIKPGMTIEIEQTQPISMPIGFEAKKSDSLKSLTEEVKAPPIIETPPTVEVSATQKPSVQPITEPPTVPHDIESAPSQGGSFWVQVGAFGVRENADKLAEKLRGAGFSVEIMSIQSTKTLLHHVRVGGYPTREAAQATGEKLKEDFGLEFRLVEM